MSPVPDSNHSLRLEVLETRTLLAGDLSDPFGLTADLNLAMHAVASHGVQGTFSTNWGNHQLVLTGTADSSLTIDLALLPSFVTNLEITSVGKVTITGTDHVDNLILTSIGSVAAEGLTVAHSLVASNVGSISLASIGSDSAQDVAYISGASTELSVRSLDNATIFAGPDLQTLTLWSDTKTPLLSAANPDMTLNFKYVPDALALKTVPGLSQSSIHIVLPPVDDGGSNPDSPSGGDGHDSTGGSNPPSNGGTDTPPSDPGSNPIVIVTLPLDERTRAFIDQIDQLIHSSQDNAGEQIFDLIAHRDETAYLTDASLVAQRDQSVPFALEQVFQHVVPTVAASFANIPSLEAPAKKDALAALFPAIDDRSLSSQPAEAVAPIASDTFVGKDLVQVDVSWALALPPAEVRPPEGIHTTTPDDHEPSIMDSARALGDYVVQRIVAEFSPGQQSLVLLVDPQPSRGIGSNKKSSGERLVPISQPSIFDVNEVVAVV